MAESVLDRVRSGELPFGDDLAALPISAVKAAARARFRRLTPQPAPAAPSHTADAIVPAGPRAMAQTTQSVVAIGTSTGGTQALEAVKRGAAQQVLPLQEVPAAILEMPADAR